MVALYGSLIAKAVFDERFGLGMSLNQIVA
jgi:hypothetical protein